MIWEGLQPRRFTQTYRSGLRWMYECASRGFVEFRCNRIRRQAAREPLEQSGRIVWANSAKPGG